MSAQIPGLFTTGLSYDARGRLSSFSQGAGAEQRQYVFTYNGEGYLSAVRDPLQRSVGFDYDSAGRIAKQILPDNREIHFNYDPNGNLTSITPPGRPDHVFGFTSIDLLAGYTPPNVGGSSATTYVYNTDSQLTQVSRPDGSAITLSYDAVSGRLGSFTTPRGTTALSYNATSGNIQSITAPDGGAITYGYDGSVLKSKTWSGSMREACRAFLITASGPPQNRSTDRTRSTLAGFVRHCICV